MLLSLASEAAYNSRWLVCALNRQFSSTPSTPSSKIDAMPPRYFRKDMTINRYIQPTHLQNPGRKSFCSREWDPRLKVLRFVRHRAYKILSLWMTYPRIFSMLETIWSTFQRLRSTCSHLSFVFVNVFGFFLKNILHAAGFLFYVNFVCIRRHHPKIGFRVDLWWIFSFALPFTFQPKNNE